LGRITPSAAGTGDHGRVGLGEVFRGDAEIDKGTIRRSAGRSEGLRSGACDEDRAAALHPREMRLGPLPRRGTTGEQLADECGTGGEFGNPRAGEADIARTAMPGAKPEDCAVWR